MRRNSEDAKRPSPREKIEPILDKAHEKGIDDPLVRAKYSLYLSLALNIAYIAIKLFAGIAYRSVWFITVAVYYIFLTLLRYSLTHYIRRYELKRDPAAEYRRYRLCGVLLAAMNVALSGIVVLIVRQNRGYDYPGILIYLMIALTFFLTVHAAINVVRTRKHGSPVMSAARVVSLTAAMVTILSLETAMISQFGDGNGDFRKIVLSVSGALICSVVLAMSLYMIVHATKKIAEYESDPGDGKLH